MNTMPSVSTPTLRRTAGVQAGLLLALALGACTPAPVGSEQRPLTMYFVPSVDSQTIALSADEITEFLQRHVSQALYGADEGFYIESSIPASYVAVVEAFGTGRADFAALNTFNYILARDVKEYPVKALVAVVRGDGETHYKGQIIARADGEVKAIEDIDGREFAFTDPASTAGFLLPNKLFKDRGVTPANTVFAMKHDSVVTMVYQGQVDAGATYYSPPKTEEIDGQSVEVIRDARARVLTQFPDVTEKVKIVGFTEDTPNEPWVVRSNLYEDAAEQKRVEDALRAALLEFAATEEGVAALDRLYDITGLAQVDDRVYDGIRSLILKSDIDLESSN